MPRTKKNADPATIPATTPATPATETAEPVNIKERTERRVTAALEALDRVGKLSQTDLSAMDRAKVIAALENRWSEIKTRLSSGTGSASRAFTL